MKIQYCSRYGKYVSAYHCEFFNEGKDCMYYSDTRWNRIKDLMADRKRPKQDIGGVIKPLQCNLIGGEDRRQASQTA